MHCALRACIAQPAGVRRGCMGERKCSGRACRCAGVRRGCVGEGGSAREGREKMLGASEGLRRGMGGEVGGECIAQPEGVRRGCVGERKCSGRACRCAGASEGLRWGMGREGGGFNAHSPQQHARTCIIIYTSALSTP